MSGAKGQWWHGVVEIHLNSFETMSWTMIYTLEPYSSLSPLLYPTPLRLFCPAADLWNKRNTEFYYICKYMQFAILNDGFSGGHQVSLAEVSSETLNLSTFSTTTAYFFCPRGQSCINKENCCYWYFTVKKYNYVRSREEDMIDGSFGERNNFMLFNAKRLQPTHLWHDVMRLSLSLSPPKVDYTSLA